MALGTALIMVSTVVADCRTFPGTMLSAKMSMANKALPRANTLLEEGMLTWDLATLSEVGPLLEKDQVNCGGIVLSKAVS
jgi:hypothetical protein